MPVSRLKEKNENPKWKLLYGDVAGDEAGEPASELEAGAELGVVDTTESTEVVLVLAWSVTVLLDAEVVDTTDATVVLMLAWSVIELLDANVVVALVELATAG